MELYKIEIIIANAFLQRLTEQLEDLGVHGYTALEISRGKGIKRGEHLAEGLLPTTRNSLLFSVAPKQVVDQVITQLKIYLEERGGILMTYKIDYASGLS